MLASHKYDFVKISSNDVLFKRFIFHKKYLPVSDQSSGIPRGAFIDNSDRFRKIKELFFSKSICSVS